MFRWLRFTNLQFCQKLRNYETTGYLKSDDFYVGKELGNGFNASASEGLKHKAKSNGWWKAMLNLRYGVWAHKFEHPFPFEPDFPREILSVSLLLFQ